MFKSKKNTVTLSQDELSAIIAGAIAQAMAAQKPQTQDPKPPKPPKPPKTPKAPKKAKGDKPEIPAPVKPAFKLDGKAVEATGFLPHAVYTWNRTKAEELGGKVSKSSEGFFKAAFTSVKKAEKFLDVASYDIPEGEYENIVKERNAKAEAYKKAKADKHKANKALADELRAHGITPNGEPWKYAQAHGAKAAVKKYGK